MKRETTVVVKNLKPRNPFCMAASQRKGGRHKPAKRRQVEGLDLVQRLRECGGL